MIPAPTLPTEWTPANLSSLAASCYRHAPLLARLMMTYRPYIVPFGLLMAVVPNNARVLDIGCGAGLFLALLARTRGLASGTGVDASGAAVAAARAMAESIGAEAHLEFVRSNDVTGWPGGTFDVVSLIDVMHHVASANRQGFFAAAAARVAPGGLLLYKDMVSRPLWRAAANRFHDLVLARQWIRYVPYDAAAAWAGQAGLPEEWHVLVNRLWYGHELAVFRRPA